MTRFKELSRIEAAIKNKDTNEILWALNYCETRIKVLNQLGLNKTRVKQQTEHWEELIGKLNEIGSARIE